MGGSTIWARLEGSILQSEIDFNLNVEKFRPQIKHGRCAFVYLFQRESSERKHFLTFLLF